MNIKKQYSIRSLGTPTIFSGQNIFQLQKVENTESNYNIWLNGNKIASNITIDSSIINTNPSLPDASKPEEFERNLQILNGRLNSIHKELTYWDLYKLSASVNKDTDFPSVFNSLAIGQSLVINCESFSLNGITYHRGDVVVKINEDMEIKVDSVATGIYFPQKIVKSNGDTFEINYQYNTLQPREDGEGVDSEDNEVKIPPTGGYPKPDLTFKMEASNPADSKIYGQYSELESFSFDKITNVKPVIKIFTEDGEEIAEEYEIEENTDQYTIRNWKRGLAHHIQVK